MDAYANPVRRPYGNILVDLTNLCPEERRLRTNILAEEGDTIIFQPL